MRNYSRQFSKARRDRAGFTLAEVVISITILGLAIQGIVLGYIFSSRRADWSARSLAAQALAAQGAEQARVAKWDTRAWPQGVGPGKSDELGLTNYTDVTTLEVPNKPGPIVVTNYVSVTEVSDDPPVRQIRSDCVWPFPDRGWFTNSVILMRAADQ